MANEKDTEFMEKWKKTPKDDKVYVRATILKEAAEFIEDKAFKDFGMNNRAVGMEISKLILQLKKDSKNKPKSE